MIGLAAGVLLIAACSGGTSSRSPSQSDETARQTSSECHSGAHPDRPGPADQARPTGDGGMLPAAVDTSSALLVAQSGRETWVLDLCTNTWQQRHPALKPPRSTALVYDPDSDLVLSHSGMAYDVDRDEWATFAMHGDQQLEDPVYDPGSERLIMRDGRTGVLWSFRDHSDTWQRVPGGDGPGDRDPTGSTSLEECTPSTGCEHHFGSYMVADPTRHQLILVQTDAVAAGRTWRFALTAHRWSRLQATPPALHNGYVESGGEIVFDEAADQVLLLGHAKMAAFDPDTGTWRDISLDESTFSRPSSGSQEQTGPLARSGHTLVYDPLNKRVLLLGGQHLVRQRGLNRWVRASDVWAYDTTSDSWTELVPPATGSSGPLG